MVKGGVVVGEAGPFYTMVSMYDRGDLGELMMQKGYYPHREWLVPHSGRGFAAGRRLDKWSNLPLY
jgi:hypothetical protein